MPRTTIELAKEAGYTSAQFRCIGEKFAEEPYTEEIRSMTFNAEQLEAFRALVEAKQAEKIAELQQKILCLEALTDKMRAKLLSLNLPPMLDFPLDALEKHDAEVAAKEQERCAIICESEHVGESINDECDNDGDRLYNSALRHALKAIREAAK